MVKVGDRYQGRYQVMERIGEGTFAQVFRARDVNSGDFVALKILKDPYLTEREIVERFQREVFAVASINSPHVVRLKDFGLSDEAFFIVMEFIKGPTLREVMREAWTLKDARTVLGHVAHALQAAHAQGILHRDLKPENVMLVPQPDGGLSAKVLDFGFAKLPELERKLGLEPLTRQGFCFGTPQYMAPEQIRGKAVDAGVDLYALGVMAYELVAGRRPWDGNDARELMLSVLKSGAPPIKATVIPGIDPTVFNRFAQRTLAKDRAERPADAGTFFAELDQAIGGPGGDGGTLLERAANDSIRSLSAVQVATEEEPEEQTILGGPQFLPEQTQLAPARGLKPAKFLAAKTAQSPLRSENKLPSTWVRGLDVPDEPPVRDADPVPRPMEASDSRANTLAVRPQGIRGFGSPNPVPVTPRPAAAPTPAPAAPPLESSPEESLITAPRGTPALEAPRSLPPTEPPRSGSAMRILGVLLLFALVAALAYLLGRFSR